MSLEFDRWLRKGVLHLSLDTGYNDPYPACMIRNAVRDGADEVLLAMRVLTGYLGFDNHPEFWTPGWWPPVEMWEESFEIIFRAPEGVAPATHQANLEDYFLKHKDFHRIDEYYIKNNCSVLHGSHEPWFLESNWHVFVENLKKPRTLRIINASDQDYTTQVPWKSCVVQLGQNSDRFLSFTIKYSK